MNNFELEIFRQITKTKSIVSNDDEMDIILFNLGGQGYIKTKLLDNNRLEGYYLNTKKPMSLRRLLNIKEDY